MDFPTLHNYLQKNFSKDLVKKSTFDETNGILTFPATYKRAVTDIYRALKVNLPKSSMTTNGNKIIIHLSAATNLQAKSRLLATLTEKQKKLDVNGDGQIDADDLRKVRNGELGDTD
jgi:hypothetical protein